MKFTIFFSLLLVGVCSGHILEQTHTHDDRERMHVMSKMDSNKDFNKERDSRDTKTTELNDQKQSYDSQRQSYDSPRQVFDSHSQSYDAQKQDYNTKNQDYSSQNQGYESQKQGYDANKQDYNAQKQSQDSQKQDYDSWSRGYDSQKPSYDSQKQIYDSQQQEYHFQKPSHHIYKKLGGIEGVYNNQKLDQFLKQDNDQNRDDSSLYVEKEMKKDNSQRMQPNNQRPQAFFGVGELAKNVGDYIRGIFGHWSNDSYVAKVYSDEVPSFADPLDVGKVNTSFASITTKYKDVQFYGLKNAYQVVMEVDTKNHQIVARVPLGKVEIKGQYTYSNRPTHNFTISLVDSVYIQTTSYMLKDRAVEWGQSSGQIQYSQENSFYDRIGFIAQVLQGQFGKHLVNSVAPKVHHYISPKLSNIAERTIWDVTENFQRAQIVSSLQAGVSKIVQKIKEHLANNHNANLELNSQNSQEYQYRNYKVNLQSVSLQNIQNFTLLSNKVTYTDTMVHSYIDLSLSQPTVSAHISYYSNEDAQKHEIHAQYLVDNIHAKLELHKDLSGGQLQLLSVKVYLSKIHAAPSQGNYKGDLSGLVEFLASKLQQYVDQSLENFLTSQVNGILDKVNQEYHSFSQNHKFENGYPSNGYPSNGYSSNGFYYESGPSSKGEYSGSGHTDMGQLGNRQNTGRGYSGYNNQQYFKNSE